MIAMLAGFMHVLQLHKPTAMQVKQAILTSSIYAMYRMPCSYAGRSGDTCSTAEHDAHQRAESAAATSTVLLSTYVPEPSR
jgi:hypothetical protein